MKQTFRIIIGLAIFPVPLIVGTWIWLWENKNIGWLDTIGLFTWHLVSGNWDKLPD